MKLDSLPRTSPIQINNGSNSFTRHWQIWLSGLYKNLNTQTVKDDPVFDGVTITGEVEQVASWNYDGTFARICITLTPSGGGTTESASGAYLLLQGSHAFGVCQVDDLTANTVIGLATLNDNKLYLPSWVAMSNTVRITAILDAGE
jgi:hypothetical protein